MSSYSHIFTSLLLEFIQRRSEHIYLIIEHKHAELMFSGYVAYLVANRIKPIKIGAHLIRIK